MYSRYVSPIKRHMGACSRLLPHYCQVFVSPSFATFFARLINNSHSITFAPAAAVTRSTSGDTVTGNLVCNVRVCLFVCVRARAYTSVRLHCTITHYHNTSDQCLEAFGFDAIMRCSLITTLLYDFESLLVNRCATLRDSIKLLLLLIE